LEIFIEIDFFCVSKLSIDLFFKLPVSRFLAINIEGKIGQLTVRRTSSFNNKVILRQSYQVELNVSGICFSIPQTPNYIPYGVISGVML
jgi:hypothetical protein